jgi:hypothetical protein
VLTDSVDRCVAASSRPDQPNASPVASEGRYLPSRVITLPITKKRLTKKRPSSQS